MKLIRQQLQLSFKNCYTSNEKMENYGKLRKNVSAEGNSMKKFVREIGQNQSIGDFRKAQDMVPDRGPLYPNLVKLSLKPKPAKKYAPIFNKDNFPRGKRKQSEDTSFVGIEYLPASLAKKPLLDVKNRTVSASQPKVSVKTKRRAGSDLVLITGDVQFVLKMFKMYPDFMALYEVYGCILKTYKGKIRFEGIVIMRSESGPVLQGFYFDFNKILSNFHPGNWIRCVGQFTRQNRFHIHKIQSLTSQPPEAVLTRIQNVNAFALLQASTENNLKATY